MKCGCVIRPTLNEKTGTLVLTSYKLTVLHVDGQPARVSCISDLQCQVRLRKSLWKSILTMQHSWDFFYYKTKLKAVENLELNKDFSSAAVISMIVEPIYCWIAIKLMYFTKLSTDHHQAQACLRFLHFPLITLLILFMLPTFRLCPSVKSPSVDLNFNKHIP